MAGSDRTPWVAMAEMSAAPRSARSSAAAQMVPAVSIMSSMSTQCRPCDLTDDVERLDLVVGAPGPALVHEGEVGAEVLAEPLRHPHPTGVGRDDHEITGAQPVELLHEHGRGGQVVEGDVEEALDLPRVEVDAHHPVGARHLEHVGDELGGDGLAARRLAVLARVPVVGAHRGDPLGRRPLGGVDHDELLHDRVVHGPRVGLDDEDVTTAQRALVAAVDLAVGELAQIGPAELDTEMLGDLLGQRRVRPPGHELETPLRDQLHMPERYFAAEVSCHLEEATRSWHR